MERGRTERKLVQEAGELGVITKLRGKLMGFGDQLGAVCEEEMEVADLQVCGSGEQEMKNRGKEIPSPPPDNPG